MHFEADYFDGKSSRGHRVGVTVEGGIAQIRGDIVSMDIAVTDIHVQTRLGNMPRRIRLPEGAILVTPDHAEVERALGVPKIQIVTHRLESNLAFVFTALVLLLFAGFFAYTDGIPWLAERIEQRLPVNTETEIGEEGLNALDKLILEKSQLFEPRRQRLTDLFNDLVPFTGLAVKPRIEFRDGGWIGANALALPGGIVVVTDQLVSVLETDDLIAAVLAHELGHVQHRHSLRQLLQRSMTGLIAFAVMGDVSGVGALASAVPTVLIHSHYSRDFEREADTFAFALLKRAGRSPLDLGHALDTLERSLVRAK